MAKQSKSKKRTKGGSQRKQPPEPKRIESPFAEEPDCELRFTFADAIAKDPESVRRLAHYAVDYFVDDGCHEVLCAVVAECLAFIARHQLTKKVTEFVHGVWAEEQEATDG